MRHPDIAMVFIRNPEGEWFVVQRHPSKKRFPLYYALGAGGKVDPGETPEEAAQRETEEELGVRPILDLTGAFDYPDASGTYRATVFTATHTGPFTVCTNEFCWSGWMDTAAICDLIDQGKMAPDTADAFRLVMKMVSA